MTGQPAGDEAAGERPPPELRSAVVIGTGLIGTSIALALRERGVAVGLADHDPAAARLAADIGAGAVLADGLNASVREPADLAVLAVPPAAAAAARSAATAASTSATGPELAARICAHIRPSPAAIRVTSRIPWPDSTSAGSAAPARRAAMAAATTCGACETSAT